MARPKIVHCRHCGRYCENLSHRKMCPECSIERMKRAAREIRAGEGEFYELWKARIIQKLKER